MFPAPRSGDGARNRRLAMMAAIGNENRVAGGETWDGSSCSSIAFLFGDHGSRVCVRLIPPEDSATSGSGTCHGVPNFFRWPARAPETGSGAGASSSHESCMSQLSQAAISNAGRGTEPPPTGAGAALRLSSHKQARRQCHGYFEPRRFWPTRRPFPAFPRRCTDQPGAGPH